MLHVSISLTSNEKLLDSSILKLSATWICVSILMVRLKASCNMWGWFLRSAHLFVILFLNIFLQRGNKLFNYMWVPLILWMDCWWSYKCSIPSVGINHDRSHSCCLMFLRSCLTWFMVRASEKLLLRLTNNWSSEQLPLVNTTLCSTPINFMMISVLKSCPLILQTWSNSSIHSLKTFLLTPL